MQSKQRNRGGRSVFHIAVSSTHAVAGDEVVNRQKRNIRDLVDGTLGELLDVPDKLHRPGFVSIRVQGEVLYTFARDLQDNAIVERMTSNIFD